MNKIELKKLIFDKYNGKCAYTGKDLDDKWQIDHIHPKSRIIQSDDVVTDTEDIKNLTPAISIVNHYKRDKTLCEFRTYISEFHVRLAKLPKKTKSQSTLKRISYMYRIAELFDITVNVPFTGKFYFEKVS